MNDDEILVNGIPISEVSIKEWQNVVFSAIPPSAGRLSLTIGEPWHATTLEPYLRPDDPYWYWHWNPKNSVGQFSIMLRRIFPDGQEEITPATLSVIPQKIEQHEYEQLLEDLRVSVHMVLYALSASQTVAGLQTPDERIGVGEETHVLEMYHRFFREYMPLLVQAGTHIARQPHTRTQKILTRIDAGQAYDMSYGDQHPEEVVSVAACDTPVPSRMQHPCIQDTPDTYENRLLKRVLDEVWQRGRSIATLATAWHQSALHNNEKEKRGVLLVHINTALRQLQQVRATCSFLAQVGPLTTFHGATHMIRRSQPYRHVYQVWQALRTLPFFRVDSPIFTLPVHELPRLYEYWCVVQMVSALLHTPDIHIISQQLMAIMPSHSYDDIPLHLLEDVPLLVCKRGEMVYRLRYQPRYSPFALASDEEQVSIAIGSLDSSSHIPDIALEIEQPESPTVVVVLDAKYRLTAQGHVPDDARSDAYTYLSTIGTRQGERVVRQAVILYPGQGSIVSHASGLCELPLRPGNTVELVEWVRGVVL